MDTHHPQKRSQSHLHRHQGRGITVRCCQGYTIRAQRQGAAAVKGVDTFRYTVALPYSRRSADSAHAFTNTCVVWSRYVLMMDESAKTPIARMKRRTGRLGPTLWARSASAVLYEGRSTIESAPVVGAKRGHDYGCYYYNYYYFRVPSVCFRAPLPAVRACPDPVPFMARRLIKISLSPSCNRRTTRIAFPSMNRWGFDSRDS